MVFLVSGIIKVEVSVISRSRRLNNDQRIIAAITVYFQTLKNVQLSDIALGNHALHAQPADYSLHISE